MGKKIALGVGIFVVLLGGIIALVLSLTVEPVKVIRAQLEAINQGDYARAYSYCSTAMKANLSQAEFTAFIEKNAVVLKAKDGTFNERNISNGVATIRGKLTGQSGAVATVRYTLVKENDRWVIQGVRLGEE